MHIRHITLLQVSSDIDPAFQRQFLLGNTRLKGYPLQPDITLQSPLRKRMEWYIFHIHNCHGCYKIVTIKNATKT